MTGIVSTISSRASLLFKLFEAGIVLFLFIVMIAVAHHVRFLFVDGFFFHRVRSGSKNCGRGLIRQSRKVRTFRHGSVFVAGCIFICGSGRSGPNGGDWAHLLGLPVFPLPSGRSGCFSLLFRFRPESPCFSRQGSATGGAAAKTGSACGNVAACDTGSVSDGDSTGAAACKSCSGGCDKCWYLEMDSPGSSIG